MVQFGNILKCNKMGCFRITDSLETSDNEEYFCSDHKE